MRDDPGRWLDLHKAPEGLVERAFLVPLEPTRVGTRSFSRVAALAAVFLGGLGAGWLVRGAATEPGTSDSLATAQPQADDVVLQRSVDSVPVRLTLHQPGGSHVSVAGSWNDWNPEANPMQVAPDGSFHTVIVLPKGRHEYMFVVDGEQWVCDPSAAVTRDDGFGRTNAILEV